jgi:glyoxylate reductase
MLSKECDVAINKNPTPPTRRALLKNVNGKQGILCTLSDKIDAEAMDSAGESLGVISSYSTGFEHIDVKEATARGIYVTFTADILAEATADLTFGLILACARRIVEADKIVRQNRWKVGWSPDLMLGHNVYRTTLGIIGLGRIGSAVARRAKGFDMKVLYNSRKRKNSLERKLGARYASLTTLLSHSDFVTIHLSLNSSSQNLIDFAKLEMMKKTAFLINTSRGQVLNEPDLAKALRSGLIAGAGLDVFGREPLPRSSSLLRMKNVTLLPHIGSATFETRSKMGEVAAKNLLDVLNGTEPEPAFLVNPRVKSVRPLKRRS